MDTEGGEAVNRKTDEQARAAILAYCRESLARGEYPGVNAIAAAVHCVTQRVCTIRRALCASGELELELKKGGEGTTHSRRARKKAASIREMRASRPGAVAVPRAEESEWRRMTREHYQRERGIRRWASRWTEGQAKGG
jgi:hypothetical protein